MTKLTFLVVHLCRNVREATVTLERSNVRPTVQEKAEAGFLNGSRA